MYRDRFQSLRHTWRCHDGDLVRAFRQLQDAGRRRGHHLDGDARLLPAAWTATGPPSAPRSTSRPTSTRSTSAAAPRGMWLGECGYVPGVDELLREAAIRYFFVDTHGILFADRPPGLRRLRAALLPARGVAAFAPRHRVVRSRCGAPRRATRAIRTTATSTATSASTCRSTTSGRTSTPRGTGSTPASSTTRSPTTSCTTSGSTTRTIARGRAGLHAAHFRGNRAAAGRAPARRTWTGRRSSSARTTPSSTATGGSRARMFLDDLFRQLHYDQDVDRDDHAGRLPRPPPHQPGRDAVRVVVGAQRATTSTG